jgi:hypothetical protein
VNFMMGPGMPGLSRLSGQSEVIDG